MKLKIILRSTILHSQFPSLNILRKLQICWNRDNRVKVFIHYLQEGEYEYKQIRPHSTSSLLQVLEGAEEGSPEVGHYCGHQRPEPLLLRSPAALVRFKSTYGGYASWKLSWESYNASYIQGMPTATTGNLYRSSSVVKSSRYDIGTE